MTPNQHSDLYPDAVEVECSHCGNVTVMSSAPRSLSGDSVGDGADLLRVGRGADYSQAQWVIEHASDPDVPNTEVGLAAAVIRLEEQLEAALEQRDAFTYKSVDIERLQEQYETLRKAAEYAHGWLLAGPERDRDVAAHLKQALDGSNPAMSQDEWRGVYPAHCINPEDCRGKTHCPRELSCVE